MDKIARLLERIDALPRVRVAHLPTPLEKATQLGETLGVATFIKRDDCTGLALGGNKARKLEFVAGDAAVKGASELVTSGGIQSNHVRQTGALAARMGLGCSAVLHAPAGVGGDAYSRSGNALLDRLLGVEVTVVHEEAVQGELRRVEDSIRASGGTPYIIPVGASNGIGAVGYVHCAAELALQFVELGIRPSHLFVATGSAGTQAGLVAGFSILGISTEVVGIAASGNRAEKEELVRSLVATVLKTLGYLDCLDVNPVLVLDDWVGGGYGVTTFAGDYAIKLTAQTEGILLDPVYTGKAMAGVIDCIRTHRLGSVTDLVFLHTGGTPALFAYL